MIVFSRPQSGFPCSMTGKNKKPIITFASCSDAEPAPSDGGAFNLRKLLLQLIMLRKNKKDSNTHGTCCGTVCRIDISNRKSRYFKDLLA